MNITRRVFLNHCLFLAGMPILQSKRAEAVLPPLQGAAARADYPGYLGLEKRGLLAGREERLSAFYESCRLCPRNCRLGDKERGYCGVRENIGGTYYTLVYGKACSLNADEFYFFIFKSTNN